MRRAVFLYAELVQFMTMGLLMFNCRGGIGLENDSPKGYRSSNLWLCEILWPLSLKVRTLPFQGKGIGFKSHRGHCDHSITASTADCGSAYGGSIPSGHIWVGKP